MDNVKDFWKGLPDFWTAFENRDAVEDFWEGMLGAFRESSNNLHKLYVSPYQENALATVNDKYQSMVIVTSGSQINSIQGSSEYLLPDEMVGTFNIPTLSGIETGQVLTECTDYDILDCNRISFTTLPTAGTSSDRVTLFADTSKKVDPLLFRLLKNN